MGRRDCGVFLPFGFVLGDFGVFCLVLMIRRAPLHTLFYMLQTENSYFCHPVTESSPLNSPPPAESGSQQNSALSTSFDRQISYTNSKAHENILPSQISAAVALFLFSHHKIPPIIFLNRKWAQLGEWERRNPKTDTQEFDPCCQNLQLMGLGPSPICASPNRALCAPALQELYHGSAVIRCQLKPSQSPKLPFTKDIKTDSTEHLCKIL